MSLTLTLHVHAEDHAEALHETQVLGCFNPRELSAKHPLRFDRQEQVPPIEYGQRLLAALGGPVLLAHLDALPRAPHPDGALVFRMNDPTLAAIPWEFLHTGEDFVALNYCLVREVPVVPPNCLPPAPDPALPWRLVVMGSDPLLQEVRDEQNHLLDHTPLPRLRVAAELDNLREALRAQVPPPPMRWHRLAPIRDALVDLPVSEPILFHYTGHGSVHAGQPVLYFDDGAGTMHPQSVRDLAADLRGRTYFAFLNACRTADSKEPEANLALRLVQKGVPAVLGMQTLIRDDGAVALAEVFYQQLAAGRPLAEALYWARLRLARRFSRDETLWAIPALYVASDYQWPRQNYKGPLLQAVEPPVPNTTTLQAPARLLGREIELVEVLRLFVFDRRRIVTIRGPGGMGKTALVHELASRLRFYFRDGIVAVTLARAGEQATLNAAALRADLAQQLRLRHPAFDDPAAAEAQEAALVEASQYRRVLLIFDNYETVLNALGRDEEQQVAHPARDDADAVQRLVTRLARAEVCLLFTTRQAPVDLPEEYCYPEVGQGQQLDGLRLMSASMLFRERAGRRAHSEQLPGQVAQRVNSCPLYLQLAAARWAVSGQTEAEFLANFEVEILKAEQAGVPYHQRSAHVNVGLSLDSLSAERQQALYELTVVANPVLTPLHAAVVWGLGDTTNWELGDATNWSSHQVHRHLEALEKSSSLLQNVRGAYDETRGRATAYSFQPVIAQVVRARAKASDLGPARERYSAWAAERINQAFGEGGISYSAEVAQTTRFYLPDLVAALPDRPTEQRGWDAYRLSSILRQFGRVAEAAHSYQAKTASLTSSRR